MPRNLDKWLGLATEPAIIIAQYGELKRQIPSMYSLVIVNAVAVAYTHYLYAPNWLVIYIPIVLIIASTWRIFHWMLSGDAALVDAAQARFQIRNTTLVSIPLSIGFVSWALLIDQYGGQIEQGHVAIFIAVTMIGCITCLVHLPQAALLVMVFVTSPYLAYSLIQGNRVFIAIAINIALVTGVVVKILLNNFDVFVRLIRVQEILAIEQCEAQRLSKENALLAMTDSLTGLPNRRYFFQRLEELLCTGRVTKERFVVGVFDLDRFKAVNDSYGHLFGDRLLSAVGKRFAGRAGATLVIARLGGDEFGVLITDDVDRAREIGQELCDVLAYPFEIDGNRVSVGCSGGLAMFPEAGSSAHELFDRSDYTLYHVKSVQRGSCALFSLEHETLIRSERSIEAALQGANSKPN